VWDGRRQFWAHTARSIWSGVRLDAIAITCNAKVLAFPEFGVSLHISHLHLISASTTMQSDEDRGLLERLFRYHDQSM
jgi:LytS/YehU family sensor histidine kinase